MSTSSSALPLSVRFALNMGKQSRAGALGLLAYDHFLTLGEEVEYIWKTPFSYARPLYLFNRWLALIWLVFDSIPLTPSGVVSPRICLIYLMCDNAVTLVTTLTVQLILQLRVWAIWGRSPRILFLLLVLTTIEVVIMAVLIGITGATVKRLPLVSTPTGCAYTGLLPVSSLFWVPALVFEPILCLLCVAKVWRDVPKAKGSAIWTALWRPTRYLPLVLARDSMVYFVAIFIELLTATVIFAHFPQYINIINPWATALPSILGCRLLLNMRARTRDSGGVIFTSRDDFLTEFNFDTTARSGATTAADSGAQNQPSVALTLSGGQTATQGSTTVASHFEVVDQLHPNNQLLHP